MNARLPTPLPAPGLSEEDAFRLLERTDLSEMMAEARALRDEGFGALLTYSKKLFIPLTHLCRDVCHYCTFATTPRHQKAPYMSVDAVLEAARQGAAAGCKEALFTLGEKPELRYRAAREALETLGFPSTTAYLAHVAERVLAETGLLPHLNPGTLSDEEFRALKPVGPSMGMMLESTSLRLCEKGMPHYGSPDKDPSVRLATLDAAGRAAVPFTTGLLIGIGETRRERIETLLAIRASHARSHPGSDRAELPGEGRYENGGGAGAELGGAPLDHRRRSADLWAHHEHPGAAESVPRGAAPAGGRGAERLGRGVSRDPGFRQPRSPLAPP